MNRIIALHGFMGSPADFLPLQFQLANFFALNWSYISCGPLETWAQRFTRHCPDDAVLMGYSMGGRIALHALVAAPRKFRAAIILAAHPGLIALRDRCARYASDRLWAQRILHMPWEELLMMWNQQPVLQSSKPRLTSEDNISRKVLAQYLRYFSLGQQQHLTEQINKLDIPILWLAPKNEAQAVLGLAFKNPGSQLHFIENGGHRFVFEYPLLVADHIKKFLRIAVPT